MKNEKLISGIVPAIVTAFTEDNKVNPSAAEALIKRFVAHDAAGVYVCGWTGEGAAMAVEERKQWTETVIRTTDKQLPVIVHVGATASVEDAIELARHAEQVGADAISSMAPVKSETTYEEAMTYYAKIGAATKLPFYIYWNQNFAAQNITAQQFIKDIQRIPNIAGIKYTDNDFGRLQTIIHLAKKEGLNLNVLTGPDEMVLYGQIIGADGAIGSTYNVTLALINRLYRAAKENRLEEAAALQLRENLFIDALKEPGVGVLPGIKAILNRQGIPIGNPRAPFQPLKDAQKINQLISILNS